MLPPGWPLRPLAWPPHKPTHADGSAAGEEGRRHRHWGGWHTRCTHSLVPRAEGSRGSRGPRGARPPRPPPPGWPRNMSWPHLPSPSSAASRVRGSWRSRSSRTPPAPPAPRPPCSMTTRGEGCVRAGEVCEGSGKQRKAEGWRRAASGGGRRQQWRPPPAPHPRLGDAAAPDGDGQHLGRAAAAAPALPAGPGAARGVLVAARALAPARVLLLRRRWGAEVSAGAQARSWSFGSPKSGAIGRTSFLVRCSAIRSSSDLFRAASILPGWGGGREQAGERGRRAVRLSAGCCKGTRLRMGLPRRKRVSKKHRATSAHAAQTFALPSRDRGSASHPPPAIHPIPVLPAQ